MFFMCRLCYASIVCSRWMMGDFFDLWGLISVCYFTIHNAATVSVLPLTHPSSTQREPFLRRLWFGPRAIIYTSVSSLRSIASTTSLAAVVMLLFSGTNINKKNTRKKIYNSCRCLQLNTPARHIFSVFVEERKCWFSLFSLQWKQY